MLNYSGKKWGRQIHGGQKEQASINVGDLLQHWIGQLPRTSARPWWPKAFFPWTKWTIGDQAYGLVKLEGLIAEPLSCQNLQNTTSLVKNELEKVPHQKEKLKKLAADRRRKKTFPENL